MQIPDEAVDRAVAARAHALIDRPDPMCLSDETLTREMLEAAWPVLERALYEKIEADLRQAAETARSAAPGETAAGDITWSYLSLRTWEQLRQCTWTGLLACDYIAHGGSKEDAGRALGVMRYVLSDQWDGKVPGEH